MGVNSKAADRELVGAARRGDKRALAALIERHYSVLLSLCRRAVGECEGAADVAQEAVIAAMLGLDRLREDERFGAWLYGIGLNVSRRLLQARARRVGSLDAGPAREPVAAGPDPAELVEAAEIAVRVRRAIGGLPAGQRDAVRLFYLAGLTQAEIAQELDTAPGAIKTRLHKARRTLRATLNPVWKEHYAMSTPAAPDGVPMRITDVRRTTATNHAPVRHIVFLEEPDGERRLPIWIGATEATALAVVLEDVELPRPGPYHFAAALLTAAGGQLREVRITELTEHTFYARAILTDGTAVDARPSDALTLAALTGAPIIVDPVVFDHATRTSAMFADELAHAADAQDDARTIADEARSALTKAAAELAAKTQRSG